MCIEQISPYQVDLPVKGGGLRSSGGCVQRSVDTSVVRIDTDKGISGWGESCPFGSDYDIGFAEGARAGIAELAPHLIGVDPRGLSAINQRMDSGLYGNPYAKTGIDIACWNSGGWKITGRVGGLNKARHSGLCQMTLWESSPDG